MLDDQNPGQLSLFSPDALLDETEEKPSKPPEKPLSDSPDRTEAGTTPGRHYVVFDLETKNTFEEVGGRHNMHKLEVSVGVSYDSRTDGYSTYREEELPQLVEQLRQAELVIGYNIIGFDYPVLQSYTDFDLYQLPTLDLMLGIEHSLGYRISLEKVASATLGVGKSGHGLQAIEWYRNGQWDLLVKYCRQDVKVTRDLYEFGLEHSHVLIPAAGSKRKVDVRFDQ